MGEYFFWDRNFKSICNAPLVPIEVGALDADHPAVTFNDAWHDMSRNGQLPQAEELMELAIKSIHNWLMAFRKELQAGDDLYLLYLQGKSAAQMTYGMLQGQYLHEFTQSDCFDSRRALMRQTLSMSQPGFARMDVARQKSEFFAQVTAGMFPVADGDQELVIVVPAPVSTRLRDAI